MSEEKNVTSKMPELDKILLNKDSSQIIGDFLHWLSDEIGITLCEYDGFDDYADMEKYFPYQFTTEKLLAQYFNVDLGTAEKERQSLLDEVKASNAKQ